MFTELPSLVDLGLQDIPEPRYLYLDVAPSRIESHTQKSERKTVLPSLRSGLPTPNTYPDRNTIDQVITE
jgi:hypothetical protein